MKSKILITGLSSELMQTFARQIDTSSYEIIGLSRKKYLPQIAGVKWVKGSLDELAEMTELLANTQILIHAAAVTHCFARKEYLDLNFESTKRLVDACVKAGVGQFVYVSSRTAGMDSGGYGESKFLAEQYIKAKFHNWLIFRPAEIFGGAKSEGIENVIEDVLSKKILFYPGGGERLFPVDLTDTAIIMYEQTFLQKRHQEIITINGKTGFSYRELIRYVAEIAGKNVFPISIPKPIMYLLKWFVGTFKIKIGMLPDQVDRFYAKKEIGEIHYEFKPLSEYIKKVISQRKI